MLLDSSGMASCFRVAATAYLAMSRRLFELSQEDFEGLLKVMKGLIILSKCIVHKFRSFSLSGATEWCPSN